MLFPWSIDSLSFSKALVSVRAREEKTVAVVLSGVAKKVLGRLRSRCCGTER